MTPSLASLAAKDKRGRFLSNNKSQSTELKKGQEWINCKSISSKKNPTATQYQIHSDFNVSTTLAHQSCFP